ncbi:MAG: phosphatase PAP2 family protein [Clostridiales bacterium]|nr:phosphatase PAP2 family protein [Clostridiales bacterium]
MQFEVDIIRALQMLSSPFMDLLNKGLSFFGTEMFFLIVAIVLYWCIDKKFAYRLFNVYILGVAVTNFMKQGFKRVRPFNAYQDRVRSIGEREVTYSFPSGHTESISSLVTVCSIKYGKRYKVIPVIGIVLTLLVMLSRMYLGQHYLSDVFCGLTVGVFCAIAFNALLSLFGDREQFFVIPAVIIAAVTIGVLAGLHQLNDSADILKGLGAFVAFDIGYFVEKRFVRYDVSAHREWWTYVLRVVIGGGVTIAIQNGFKLFLPESIPMLYCFLRYFVMAAFASLLAPTIFKLARI